MLRQVHYDTYNKDYGKQHGNLDWESSQDSMDTFTTNKILPEIFQLDIGTYRRVSVAQGFCSSYYEANRPKIGLALNRLISLFFRILDFYH